MSEKKVLVLGYFANNLGDDLLFNTLISRYPNHEFDLYCYDHQTVNHYKSLFKEFDVNILHLNVFIGYLFKIYRKLFRVRFNCPFCKINLESYSAIVYIGGSIFQEGGHILESITECLKKNRNVYIIGSSFGPYKSENFLLDSRKVLSQVKDVCFRDKKSYELFSDLSNVRISSDVVFAYPKCNVTEKSKSIGISLIELGWRNELCKYKSKYLCLLKKIGKEALKQGYSVNLYSFCEKEGDSLACEYLKTELINTNMNSAVNIIKYCDDIDNFISSFCKNEFVVATRFHSIVLSICNNIPVFPISYMNKIDNLLSDIKFDGTCLSIKDLDEFEINKNIELLFVRQNIDMIDNSQFEKLDLIL